MSRIVFESERPPARIAPSRADIACFVGLVRCIERASLPPATEDWLRLHGWIGGPQARIKDPDPPAPVVMPIADVPIPIETYSAFTALFDPGGSTGSFGTDYLAAAVRTFFAQGGKRCYVVRMGDPLTAPAAADEKSLTLQMLLPGGSYARDDRRSWHGVGHLAGLPDVSFLAIPDLPILSASAPQQATGAEPSAPSGPARFVECVPADVSKPPPMSYQSAAPRLAPDDYRNWAAAVRTVLEFLSIGDLREMLLVAAFPMPQNTDAAAAAADPGNSFTQSVHDVIAAWMPEPNRQATDTVDGLGPGLSTTFLQLAYPWLKTTGSHVLLESLEPPDGALVGLLARNALTRGTFTSATKVPLSQIFDVSPILSAQETTVSAAPLTWGDKPLKPKPLIERVSLFGFTPSGLALLSDVTAYAGESYRQGRIHRLVAVIRREARRLGEDLIFQSNGPALWARVQAALRQLMTRLWRLDALDGATLSDAFSVRCDRSTMTQNDLDNGRLVATIGFNAASTIELIRVTLALQTSAADPQSASVSMEAGR
jgi:hypothetical protein